MRFPWRKPAPLDLAAQLARLSPEAAVNLLDSGVLDEQILRKAPPEAQASCRTLYADVQPFSYEDWKRRHNASEVD